MTPSSTARRSMKRVLTASSLLGLLNLAQPTFPSSAKGWAEEMAAQKPAAPFGIADFERAGVSTAIAGPGIVDFAIELPGEVRPNADRTAHVAPRFAGTVREVRVGIGDQVRENDVLAVIESDTLARYQLHTALAGTVVDKHVVPGEVVDRDTPLFIIADLANVWVDISVYQPDLATVGTGRSVRISAGDGIADAETRITYVSPIVDQATRTAIARAVVPNPDGVWRPGLFVTAYVLDPRKAAIVVPRTALQQHEGRPVLFVVTGNAFEPRPVTIGLVGRTTAEIVSGLSAGERYAATNSFVVKAELEKAATESDER